GEEPRGDGITNEVIGRAVLGAEKHDWGAVLHAGMNLRQIVAGDQSRELEEHAGGDAEPIGVRFKDGEDSVDQIYPAAVGEVADLDAAGRRSPRVSWKGRRVEVALAGE